MKVLYLHQYFRTDEMAGGTRSFEIARRLVEFGVDVTVITSTNDFDKYFESKVSGINVNWIPVKYSQSMGFYQRIRSFITFAFISTIYAIKSPKPDVIYASSTPLTIAIPGLIASLKHSSPMIFEVRDLWPAIPISMGYINNIFLKYSLIFFEKSIYFFSKKVVVLSEGMQKELINRGIKSEKIYVVNNGVDINKFNLLSTNTHQVKYRSIFENNRPFTVAYIGTIGIVNGIDYFVELAKYSRMNEDKINFLVVGDGSELCKVKDLALEYNLLDVNIYFQKTVMKKDVPSILCNIDLAFSLVINNSDLWNNAANKFSETLSCSIPIGINHLGWQADLINKNSIGVVLDPINHLDAYKNLYAFLTDSKKVFLAKKNARKVAKRFFDYNSISSNLFNIINQAYSDKKNQKH